jgi:hypothetical protein
LAPQDELLFPDLAALLAQRQEDAEFSTSEPAAGRAMSKIRMSA